MREGRTDENSTSDNGSDATAEGAVEDDRKRLVDDDIGEEQRDEDPVLALVEEIEDASGILMLRLFGIARDYL